MAKFVLAGSAYVTQDANGVTHVAKTGDEVELNPEQVQRLNAGKDGSPFVTLVEFNRRKREGDDPAAANPFASMPAAPPKASEGN